MPLISCNNINIYCNSFAREIFKFLRIADSQSLLQRKKRKSIKHAGNCVDIYVKRQHRQQQCRFSFVLFISFVRAVQLSNLFFPPIHPFTWARSNTTTATNPPTNTHAPIHLTVTTTVRLRFTLPFAIFERNTSEQMCVLSSRSRCAPRCQSWRSADKYLLADLYVCCKLRRRHVIELQFGNFFCSYTICNMQ